MSDQASSHPCHNLSNPSKRLFWCRHCMAKFADPIQRWRHSKTCKKIISSNPKQEIVGTDGKRLVVSAGTTEGSVVVSKDDEEDTQEPMVSRRKIRRLHMNDLTCQICQREFYSIDEIREHVKNPCRKLSESEDSSELVCTTASIENIEGKEKQPSEYANEIEAGLRQMEESLAIRSDVADEIVANQIESLLKAAQVLQQQQQQEKQEETALGIIENLPETVIIQPEVGVETEYIITTNPEHYEVQDQQYEAVTVESVGNVASIAPSAVPELVVCQDGIIVQQAAASEDELQLISEVIAREEPELTKDCAFVPPNCSSSDSSKTSSDNICKTSLDDSKHKCDCSSDKDNSSTKTSNRECHCDKTSNNTDISSQNSVCSCPSGDNCLEKSDKMSERLQENPSKLDCCSNKLCQDNNKPALKINCIDSRIKPIVKMKTRSNTMSERKVYPIRKRLKEMNENDAKVSCKKKPKVVLKCKSGLSRKKCYDKTEAKLNKPKTSKMKKKIASSQNEKQIQGHSNDKKKASVCDKQDGASHDNLPNFQSPLQNCDEVDGDNIAKQKSIDKKVSQKETKPKPIKSSKEPKCRICDRIFKSIQLLQKHNKIPCKIKHTRNLCQKVLRPKSVLVSRSKPQPQRQNSNSKKKSNNVKKPIHVFERLHLLPVSSRRISDSTLIIPKSKKSGKKVRRKSAPEFIYIPWVKEYRNPHIDVHVLYKNLADKEQFFFDLGMIAQCHLVKDSESGESDIKTTECHLEVDAVSQGPDMLNVSSRSEKDAEIQELDLSLADIEKDAQLDSNETAGVNLPCKQQLVDTDTVEQQSNETSVHDLGGDQKEIITEDFIEYSYDDSTPPPVLEKVTQFEFSLKCEDNLPNLKNDDEDLEPPVLEFMSTSGIQFDKGGLLTRVYSPCDSEDSYGWNSEHSVCSPVELVSKDTYANNPDWSTIASINQDWPINANKSPIEKINVKDAGRKSESPLPVVFNDGIEPQKETDFDHSALPYIEQYSQEQYRISHLVEEHGDKQRNLSTEVETLNKYTNGFEKIVVDSEQVEDVTNDILHALGNSANLNTNLLQSIEDSDLTENESQEDAASDDKDWESENEETRTSSKEKHVFNQTSDGNVSDSENENLEEKADNNIQSKNLTGSDRKESRLENENILQDTKADLSSVSVTLKNTSVASEREPLSLKHHQNLKCEENKVHSKPPKQATERHFTDLLADICGTSNVLKPEETWQCNLKTQANHKEKGITTTNLVNRHFLDAIVMDNLSDLDSSKPQCSKQANSVTDFKSRLKEKKMKNKVTVGIQTDDNPYFDKIMYPRCAVDKEVSKSTPPKEMGNKMTSAINPKTSENNSPPTPSHKCGERTNLFESLANNKVISQSSVTRSSVSLFGSLTSTEKCVSEHCHHVGTSEKELNYTSDTSNVTVVYPPSNAKILPPKHVQDQSSECFERTEANPFSSGEAVDDKDSEGILELVVKSFGISEKKCSDFPSKISDANEQTKTDVQSTAIIVNNQCIESTSCDGTNDMQIVVMNDNCDESSSYTSCVNVVSTPSKQDDTIRTLSKNSDLCDDISLKNSNIENVSRNAEKILDNVESVKSKKVPNVQVVMCGVEDLKTKDDDFMIVYKRKPESNTNLDTSKDQSEIKECNSPVTNISTFRDKNLNTCDASKVVDRSNTHCHDNIFESLVPQSNERDLGTKSSCLNDTSDGIRQVPSVCPKKNIEPLFPCDNCTPSDDNCTPRVMVQYVDQHRTEMSYSSLDKSVSNDGDTYSVPEIMNTPYG